MTSEEIQDRIRELKEEQFRLRFRSATMELENPKLLTQIRRDIARMNTILSERELAQQS
jgi:large subunit ribosomal protein L29